MMAETEILVPLVMRVMRAFYYNEPKLCIVVDLLLETHAMKEDDLAKCMHMQPKDIRQLCGLLERQGILKSETRTELDQDGFSSRPVIKEEELGQRSSSSSAASSPAASTMIDSMDGRRGRKVQKSYYYLDYKHFVNVVKWKIHKISKSIEKQVANQSLVGQVNYKCPVCQKTYSMLEVNSLVMDEEGFKCDVCCNNLIHDMGASGPEGISEKYTRFMNETKPIVELLKQTDKLVIPEFVLNLGAMSSMRNPAQETENRELAVSKEGGALAGEIVVELVTDTSSHIQGQTRVIQSDHQAMIEQYYASLQPQASPMTTVADDNSEDEEFEPVDIEATVQSFILPDSSSQNDDDDDEEFVEVDGPDTQGTKRRLM